MKNNDKDKDRFINALRMDYCKAIKESNLELATMIAIILRKNDVFDYNLCIKLLKENSLSSQVS